jgi:hypothetical protein
MRLLLTLGTAQDNENFVKATYFLMQPNADPNQITDRWSDFIEHPDGGRFAVFLHEGESYPIKSDVDPDLFAGYLQKYIDEGILSENCLDQARNYLIVAAGSFLDVGQAIENTFMDNGGADLVLSMAEAMVLGWLPWDESNE